MKRPHPACAFGAALLLGVAAGLGAAVAGGALGLPERLSLAELAGALPAVLAAAGPPALAAALLLGAPAYATLQHRRGARTLEHGYAGVLAGVGMAAALVAFGAPPAGGDRAGALSARAPALARLVLPPASGAEAQRLTHA